VKNLSKNLEGVNLDLICVVKKAIEITEVDFSVVDGLRTKEEQRQLVLEGKSWTMGSYHLADETGKANAVDLYPWVNGETNHNSKYYKLIAKAMFRASQELKVIIEWGGLWGSREDMPHWQKVI